MTFPGSYRINWNPSYHTGNRCSVCLKTIVDGTAQGTTPCHHTFHKTCLLNVVARSSVCPECYSRIPLLTEPEETEPEMVLDELSLTDRERHLYVAKLHRRWAIEAREMQFHDTAELHRMAARNHFEWAEHDVKMGVFTEAMNFRKEAVEAEIRAKAAYKEGEFKLAWEEGETARVAGYKAARAEDERH